MNIIENILDMIVETLFWLFRFNDDW